MKSKYIEIYQNFKNDIIKNSAEPLNKKRDGYLDYFSKVGLPKKGNEKYKYINIAEIFKEEYTFVTKQNKSVKNIPQSYKQNFAEEHTHKYFLIDSTLCQDRNENISLPKGVIIDSIENAAKNYPEIVENYYGKISEKQKDGLITLNGLFAQDGLFVYLPQNTELKETIELINLFNSENKTISNCRNLIILEKGAKLKIVERDITTNNHSVISNMVTEVFVKEKAEFQYYRIEDVAPQCINISSMLIEQLYKSDVTANMINLHNGTTRNNIEISLNGEFCNAKLSGMVIGGNKQISDNYTTINHNMPNCTSDTLFKYILDDYSQGGFTGELYVAKDAQKTQAYQTNKNILITKNARAQTRPQLEIYADDVKCSHGATIGQLDNNAMYYMQSRGIPAETAKKLLMNAFVLDVIENIQIDEIKEKLHTIVENMLTENSN